jgi:hypothetical protein
MKLVNKILLLLTSFIIFSACESYIEEDIFSDITSENFIDENNADQLVVGVYAQLREVYKQYSFHFYGTDIFTIKDDVPSGFNPENDYFGLTSSAGNSIWSTNYSVIARANIAVNRMQTQITWSDGNLGKRDYAIAQAKALRALSYFNLVQQYGGVVLELDETLGIRSDYTRSSEEETFALIISELEAAIPNLIDNPETGRFSKRAAQHLLAKVYLTRAYKSFSSGSDFATAASLAETAIGSYDIRSQSFAQVFDFDNQVNDEVLFAVQWGSSGIAEDRDNTKHSLFMNQVFNYPGVNRTTTPYAVSGGGYMPTPFFYSLFTDDDTREAATIHRVILADVNEPNGPDNIAAGDTVVFYPKESLSEAELKDRLNRYWVYQPDQYLFGRPSDIEGVNYLYTINPELTNFPIFKKFDDQDFNENGEGSRDTFVFRVAETHLIAAEAYLGAGDATNGLSHLNRVRERATGNSDEYSTLTIDNILNERALELAGEENRWTTLKRTGKLQERINLYNPHVVDHGAFDPSIHLLRPIPSSELQLSDGSLVQNPGY